MRACGHVHVHVACGHVPHFLHEHVHMLGSQECKQARESLHAGICAHVLVHVTCGHVHHFLHVPATCMCM